MESPISGKSKNHTFERFRDLESVNMYQWKRYILEIGISFRFYWIYKGFYRHGISWRIHLASAPESNRNSIKSTFKNEFPHIPSAGSPCKSMHFPWVFKGFIRHARRCKDCEPWHSGGRWKKLKNVFPGLNSSADAAFFLQTVPCLWECLEFQ